MTIREYAKSIGHEVVGKLTRQHDLKDVDTCCKCHFYLDEADNEYLVYPESNEICIITADGGVI